MKRMKKRTMRRIAALLFVLLLLPALAGSQAGGAFDLDDAFHEHGAVMLLLSPRTGKILYANQAAASFYGYSTSELTSMNIAALGAPESEANLQLLLTQDTVKGSMVLHQLLKDGSPRDIELYFYRTAYNGAPVLSCVLHDVTEKLRLEKDMRGLISIVVSAAVLALVALLLMFIDLKRKSKSLAKANQELVNVRALWETFYNADASYVYLKDENLNYVLVNQAFKDLYQVTDEQVAGHNDYELLDYAYAEKYMSTDREALEQNRRLVCINPWEGKVFKTTKFPVRLLDGSRGVGAYITDVTDEYALQRTKERELKRNKLLLEVFNRNFINTSEQLDFALKEILALSGSRYGIIYTYNEDTQELRLSSLSRDAASSGISPRKVCHLADAGIWAEPLRQRKPIIVNDFSQPHPLKRGLPAGHAPLARLMSVPVIIEGKIVAVMGLANKQEPYDESDVDEMIMLLSGVWSTIQRRESTEKLSYERNKDALTDLYNRRYFEEALRRLDTPENRPITILMGDVDNLKLTNDIFGHASGDILLKKIAGALQRDSREQDIIARWGGDEFVMLLPQTNSEQAQEIAERISQRLLTEKVRAIRCSISLGYATKFDATENILQVLSSAEAKMYAQKSMGKDSLLNQGLNMIITALFEKSAREKHHALRVRRLCLQFGEELALPESDLDRLMKAGYLHDIGKVIADSELLVVEGDPCDPQSADIRMHPAVGYRILSSFDATLELAEAVLSHHEAWDGSGYPRGLQGERIPLLARILAVIEAYDYFLNAIDYPVNNNDNSSYTSPARHQEALDEIRKGSGTSFDPRIADAFLRMFASGGVS